MSSIAKKIGTKTFSWNDVYISFCDGHTVSVKIAGKYLGRYNFADMGMKNGKTGNPNSQWHLLERFAQNYGRVDIEFKDTLSFRQRKFLLCRKLQNFLGIPTKEQPIIWDKIYRDYRCKFELEYD